MHWNSLAALFVFCVWLTAGVVTLVAFEAMAFCTGNPTFSSGVWVLLDAYPWLRWPLAAAWMAGALFLAWHFFWPGRKPS